MQTIQPFPDAIRTWAEVFMQRSMRDLARFMRNAGLSMAQVNTLMRLYYHDSCGVSDIARDMGISNGAASQMVDRLVQQGLLDRVEHTEDRRIRQISLSAKGRELVEQAIQARHHWLTLLPEYLTAEQQAEIAAALGTLTDAALQLEQAGPPAETRGHRKPAMNESAPVNNG